MQVSIDFLFNRSQRTIHSGGVMSVCNFCGDFDCEGKYGVGLCTHNVNLISAEVQISELQLRLHLMGVRLGSRDDWIREAIELMTIVADENKDIEERLDTASLFYNLMRKYQDDRI